MLSRISLRLISWWQLAFGVTSALGTASILLRLVPEASAQLAALGLGTWFLALGFYGALAVAGWGLLRRHAWGMLLSSAVSALQVLTVIISGGVHVEMQGGPAAGLRATAEQIEMFVEYKPAFLVSAHSPNHSFVIQINLIAVVFVWALLRARSEPIPAEAPAA